MKPECESVCDNQRLATWFEVGYLFEHSQYGFPNIDMTIRWVEAVPVVVQPDQQSNSSWNWLSERMREWLNE